MIPINYPPIPLYYLKHVFLLNCLLIISYNNGFLTLPTSMPSAYPSHKSATFPHTCLSSSLSLFSASSRSRSGRKLVSTSGFLIILNPFSGSPSLLYWSLSSSLLLSSVLLSSSSSSSSSGQKLSLAICVYK